MLTDADLPFPNGRIIEQGYNDGHWTVVAEFPDRGRVNPATGKRVGERVGERVRWHYANGGFFDGVYKEMTS